MNDAQQKNRDAVERFFSAVLDRPDVKGAITDSATHELAHAHTVIVRLRPDGLIGMYCRQCDADIATV